MLSLKCDDARKAKSLCILGTGMGVSVTGYSSGARYCGLKGCDKKAREKQEGPSTPITSIRLMNLEDRINGDFDEAAVQWTDDEDDNDVEEESDEENDDEQG